MEMGELDLNSLLRVRQGPEGLLDQVGEGGLRPADRRHVDQRGGQVDRVARQVQARERHRAHGAPR